MVKDEEDCELEGESDIEVVDGVAVVPGVGAGVGVGVESESMNDHALLQSLHTPDMSLAFTLQFQVPRDKVGV